MPYSTIDPTKTGLLFFDMLNVYYRNPDNNQVKNKALEGVMANAVLLRDAARAANIPIFYAIADHRADGTDTDPLLTDTNYSLQPWKDPERIGRQVPAARHGSWEAKVIDEIAPGPDTWAGRLSYLQTSVEFVLSDPPGAIATGTRYRYAPGVGWLHRGGRRKYGLCSPRLGNSPDYCTRRLF